MGNDNSSTTGAHHQPEHPRRSAMGNDTSSTTAPDHSMALAAKRHKFQHPTPGRPHELAVGASHAISDVMYEQLLLRYDGQVVLAFEHNKWPLLRAMAVDNRQFGSQSPLNVHDMLNSLNESLLPLLGLSRDRSYVLQATARQVDSFGEVWDWVSNRSSGIPQVLVQARWMKTGKTFFTVARAPDFDRKSKTVVCYTTHMPDDLPPMILCVGKEPGRQVPRAIFERGWVLDTRLVHSCSGGLMTESWKGSCIKPVKVTDSASWIATRLEDYNAEEGRRGIDVPSFPPGFGGISADQGKFGTCAINALIRVVRDQLLLKYRLCKYHLNTGHAKGLATYWCRAYCGVMPHTAANQITEILRTDAGAWFHKTEEDRRFKVAITPYEIGWESLVEAVEKYPGRCLCVITMKVNDYYHSVAAHSIEPDLHAAPKVVRCINSWGADCPIYKVTQQNFAYAHLMDVNVTASEVPLAESGGGEFKSDFTDERKEYRNEFSPDKFRDECLAMARRSNGVQAPETLPPPIARVMHKSLDSTFLTIKPNAGENLPNIDIVTYHISCNSVYKSGENLWGIVIYADIERANLRGKQGQSLRDFKWTPSSGMPKMRPGYIYICTDSDIKDRRRVPEPPGGNGVGHGSAYYLLTKTWPTKDIVGGGFAYQDGKWKFKSGVFNLEQKGHTGYELDNNKRMGEYEMHCIRGAGKKWIDSGLVQQNFTVKELLSNNNLLSPVDPF